MLAQGGLDLARLYPKAADLELVVATAQVLYSAVGQESATIACAVDPPADMEWIVSESTRLLFRSIDVATSHCGAADGDLPGTPTGWSRPRASVMYTRTSGNGLPTVTVSPSATRAKR